MPTEAITLRIFSGVHLGAEIRLPIGSYAIGKDASCDIILQDASLAARHIQLSVTLASHKSSQQAPEALPEQNTELLEEDLDNSPPIKLADLQVQVTFLDGDVSLYGENLADESILEARTPYYIGQTCFAWTEVDAQDYSWNTVRTLMQEQIATANTTAPVSGTDILESAEQANDVDNIDNNIDSEGDQVDASLVKEGEEESPSLFKKYKQKYPQILPFLIALLLLLTFSISIEKTVSSIPSNVKLFEEKLAKENFTSLKVFEKENGVTVQGTLQNDQERAKVYSLAQNMQFPVYLDIEIHDDLINALTTVYNIHDFYPRIEIHDESSQIKVSGYLKDELLLHVIDKYVQKNMPTLKNYTLQYNICYADKLQEILTQHLNDAQLDITDIQYLSGTIVITEDFTEESRALFDSIINDICYELDITLVIYVDSVNERKIKAIEEQKPYAKTAQSGSGEKEKVFTDSITELIAETNTPLKEYAFDVTSITLEPIKFIILSTGERVFKGGLLPGGYTLKEVEIDVLTLEKNGLLSSYIIQ